MAKLTITISIPPAALARGRPIEAHAAQPSSPTRAPKTGTLPDRLLAWAKERGEPFRAADVMKALDCSRTHAGNLLGRLLAGPQPLVRVERGLYAFGDKSARRKK